jgi:predicted AAA+ superfamily ATPase
VNFAGLSAELALILLKIPIMIIPRYLKEPLKNALTTSKNKIVILYGARQTGKTTLATDIINELDYDTLIVNADQQKYIDVLSSRDSNKLKGLVGNYKCLFIDEAQRIPEMGLNLKILHETFPKLRILVTGSSSIHIASEVTEALTGRKSVFTLFPLSLLELCQHHTEFEVDDFLEDLMIYGNYPEVYTEDGYDEKVMRLNEIGSSYLYKDIFELTGIRNKRKLSDLLRLLAFQIGSEVSVNELSRKLQISREAVNHYLYLLEESFVIFRLSGFSRNLRKEISKMDKYYFYDNGIRNMLINNFNSLDFRNDTGQLWENFILSERKKYLGYKQKNVNGYFWRVYTGGEIDYIEEYGGKLWAYEIKQSESKTRPPKSWLNSYPGSHFQVINRKNYFSFTME